MITAIRYPILNTDDVKSLLHPNTRQAKQLRSYYMMVNPKHILMQLKDNGFLGNFSLDGLFSRGFSLRSRLLKSLIFNGLIAIACFNGAYGQPLYRTMVQSTPVLSNTISEQHLQNGYDILRPNMQLIQHVPPFSTRSEGINKQKRIKQLEQQQADQKLKAMYGSGVQAQMQKTRVLNDLQSQMVFLQKQLTTSQQQLVILQQTQSRNHGTLAPAEQQRLNQLQAEINSIHTHLADLNQQYTQTNQQYTKAIERLQRLEMPSARR